MSGREGAAEARGRMGSLQALCRGLLAAWRSRDAGHESSWLWDGRRRVVGIAEASGGRALLFAELLAEGESYQLVRTAKEQLAGDVTMAEAAAMRAERDGWQALDFAICLSDEVVRFYEMELPPHMEGDEWREAAHWELDARLMAEGLDADAYAMAYRRQGEASVLLAAAEHQYLEGIQAGFASQGIALRGMVALAPDDGSDEALLAAHGLELLPAQRMFLPAIAAALAALSDEPVLSLRLWGEMIPRRHFRYRRLAALCCAVTFLILFAAAFFDTRAYFEAKRDCEREEQALALLQRDEKTMRMTAKLQQEIQQRDAKAAHLVGGRHALVQRDGPSRAAGAADGRRLAQVRRAATGQEDRDTRCGAQLRRALLVSAVLRGGPGLLPAGADTRGVSRGNGSREAWHRIPHQLGHLA